MKHLYFLFAVLFLSFTTYSQNVNENYWDGVIYFKIDKESGLILPDFSGENQSLEVFESYPEFLNLINTYEVTELVRPFKTRCPKVQNSYRLKFNNHEFIDNLIKDLESVDNVIYAEKSPIYRIQVMPNDSLASEQYYLEEVKAFEAWQVAESNYRTTVAIVDDCVKIDHPDLAANIWINPNEIEDGEDTDGNGFIDDIHGWDVSDNNNNPGAPANPPFFWGELAFTHGTHCAGIAGAVTNNHIGIAGISNNNIEIIAVKAVSNSSWLPLAIQNAVEGVDYAVAVNADVVSMSFGGGSGAFTTLQNIINAGVVNGTIFVAAAGNDGTETQFFPAAFENVIAVGATRQGDILWQSSQRGDWIDILAPGVGIYSTLSWSQPYGPQDGTSMACPLVAGAIALLKAHKPEADREEIINCLLQGCDNIDDLNPNYIGKMGHGRLNVYQSLLCLGVKEKFNLSLESNPQNAGTLTGNGEYFYEEMVNISATANEGFEFINWTYENQEVFSDQQNHSFTMPEENLTLIANFSEIPDTHYLTLLVNPENAGNVTGEGEYMFGEFVEISATANDGFAFENWTLENLNEFSDEETHNFNMPDESLTLIANFIDVSNVGINIAEEIRLTPNPFNEHIVIKNFESVKNIFITNIMGQVIENMQISSNGTINTNDLHPGIYIIHIESVCGSSARSKMVKL